MRLIIRAVLAACFEIGTLAQVATAADCTPHKMVRITYANVAPGLDPRSFAAQPKTLYRLGSKYGRIEERADAVRGVHGLVVVQEPDIWTIDLMKRVGQHIVDAGP